MRKHIRVIITLWVSLLCLAGSSGIALANDEPLDASIATPTHPASVAYVVGGDIWVKTLPDGEAQRLTRDGRNQTPSWSTSGEWISFVKESSGPQLWVVRRDGSDAAQVGLLAEPAFAWSPVADQLAFGNGGGIHQFVPETGESTQLLGQAELEVPAGTNPRIGKLAWSPDGQQLAFTWMAQTPDRATLQDGLWVVDVDEGTPVQLLEGNLPERGEMILHGWSGDGQHLLYWQAPILSASILSDGVPLFALPVDGSEPRMIVDTVLVHDDAVQVQPGSEQVAVVIGAGRAVWTDKRLTLMATDDETLELQLSADDQSAAFPVWSPDGERIAYVGMPDATNEVVGGPPAQTALGQRQLWVVGIDDSEPLTVTLEAGTLEADTPETGRLESAYRNEAAQWVDNDTLLFARLDAEGGVSLWMVGVDGTDLVQVVEELTPTPDWFGFYGYIDWRPLFAVWPNDQDLLPSTTVTTERTLADFLDGLHSELTSEEAVVLWGEPDEVTGSGLIIYQYALADGLTLWLGFPGAESLSYAQVESMSGKRFELMPLEDVAEPAER